MKLSKEQANAAWHAHSILSSVGSPIEVSFFSHDGIEFAVREHDDGRVSVLSIEHHNIDDENCERRMGSGDQRKYTDWQHFEEEYGL